MELEGRKELVGIGKSSRTWNVPTVSLRLAGLNVFPGFFGPKMAVFGPKLQFLKLRSATCESCSRPPPSSFSLKLCVIVLHTPSSTKISPESEVPRRSSDFSPFRVCCCLLLAACCCLLPLLLNLVGPP